MGSSISRRVLVEDRCLSNRGGGIKTYTQEIMRHWPAESPLRLVGFRERWARGREGHVHTNGAPVLRPLSRLFEGVSVPRDPGMGMQWMMRGYRAAFAVEARWGKYAAVFQPNHLCPAVGAPMIATIHDLSVLENPEWHTPERVARWNRYLPDALRRTRRWITVSAFTRGRMAALLGIPAESIVVIPEAARPAEETSSRPPGFPERYLLFIGTLEPRKNLMTLLHAYGQLAPAARRALPLVLVGPPGWGNSGFWEALVSHRMAGDVIVSGYLGEGQVGAALRHATALLLPSLYEGFGLPVLEAMATGCPVVCSEIPAFAEVAGVSAELLPAMDVDAWSQVMERCAEDGAWLERLRAAGRGRARAYSWESAAKLHAEVLSAAIDRDS